MRLLSIVVFSLWLCSCSPGSSSAEPTPPGPSSTSGPERDRDPGPPGPSPDPAPPSEPALIFSPEPEAVLAAWPSRFARCEPYRAEIERAVSVWWGAFPYPDAWAAQIYQESLCDPWAVSPVGAAGLAQFMPATWREQAQIMGLTATPHDDIAIEAGAAYQARMMAVWHSPRPEHERWRLGLASYNAGAGNIIAAQRACGGARDWRVIETCLPQITGRHAAETRGYVPRIERWWSEMAGADATRIHPEIAP